MIWWSSYVSIHIVKVRSFDRSKGIATKDLTILPRSILPTMAEKSKKEHHFWKTLRSQLLIFLPFDRRWETRIVDHLAASSARSFVRSRVPRNSCNSIFRNWTDFLGRFFFPPSTVSSPVTQLKYWTRYDSCMNFLLDTLYLLVTKLNESCIKEFISFLPTKPRRIVVLYDIA